MIFSFHLTILWTFLSIFAESLQDCHREDESSDLEVDFTCGNLTLDKNSNVFDQPIFRNIKSIALVDSSGGLSKDVFKNISNLKGLSIYRSYIDKFEPEANTLQYMQILNSHFSNHSNFDKCCKRLNKLFIRDSTGFNLQESVFNKLTRLQKLELMNQYQHHLTNSVFKGLTSLKKLRISGMNFQTTDSDVFHDLVKLKELYIDEANVQNLDKDTFKPLVNLRVLHITNANNLKPLPLEMFSELRGIREVALPLETWREIDVEKIPEMFPKLYIYSHTGNWKTREDERFFKAKFRRLNELIVNKINS